MDRSDYPKSNKTVSAQTSGASGSAFVAFGDAPCFALRVHNATAVAIELQVNGQAVAIPLPDGAVRTVMGIENASSVGVRRKDLTTAQVTVVGEALT